MKKVISVIQVVTILVLVIINSASAQKCCTIFKNKADKSDTVNIRFDEKGVPIGLINKYISYGSQVNVIATKVNPMKELPVFETFFSDYSAAPSSPNIGKILTELTSSDKSAKEMTKKQDEKIDKEISKRSDEAAGLYKKLGLLNFSEFSQRIDIENLLKTIPKDSIKTRDSLLSSFKRVNSALDAKVSPTPKKNVNQHIVQEQLKQANAEIERLYRQQKDLQEISLAIQKDYKDFILSIDSINYLLTLQPSIYKLFDQRFVDTEFLKKAIKQSIRLRLPDFSSDIDYSISAQGKFLKNQIDKIEILYSSLSEKIKKANENIASDSFGTNKTTEIELTNKDKKKVKVKIGTISIDVNKESLFKDQFDFISERVTKFRNQKFRDSLIIYADTVLIQTLKLYHSSFEQTIKSFQANADEITINLPYGNTEPYIIKTRCRFKVDGSTGIFVHFFGSDDRYKVVPAAQLNGADSLQIIRQHKDQMNLSLGLLANAYVYDPTKLFNPGISVGLNFTVNNNQSGSGFTQVVAGLSFISTTVERLSLTFGISLRKGQVLNTNNLTSINGREKYVFNNKNTVEPIFDSVTKLGGFFGFSYAIFGANKSSKAE